MGPKKFDFDLLYPAEQVTVLAYGAELLKPKWLAAEIRATDALGNAVEPKWGAYFSPSLDAYFNYLAPAEAEASSRYSFEVRYSDAVASVSITLRPWEMDKQMSVEKVVHGLVVAESKGFRSAAQFGTYVALGI